MELLPGELIPLLAILGFSATAIIRIIMRADERKLELRLKLKGNGGSETSKVVEDLRAELASLRETSGQYDLSLDTTLHRLERRIEFLESNARAPINPAAQETEPRSARRAESLTAAPKPSAVWGIMSGNEWDN